MAQQQLGSEPWVAVLMDQSMGYTRGVLRGIMSVSPSLGRWSACPTDLSNGSGFLDAGPLGVIIHASDAAVSTPLIARCRDQGIPVVNTSFVLDLPLPRAGVADGAVGRLAAEHLLGLGLRHLAFLGTAPHGYSRERGIGFALALRGKGVRGYVYGQPGLPGLEESAETDAMRWLLDLSRPLGLFVANDMRARDTLLRLTKLGVRVPEDVAVIGCDNDEHLCQMTKPHLSSVAIDCERIGAEAALLIDRLMLGETAPAGPVLIEPLGVVARQSTDVLAVEDEDLARALRYIHDNYHRPIDIADICEAVSMSRSTLGRRFLQFLGRGPLEELARLRMAKARLLLLDHDLDTLGVARRSGFRSAAHLSRTFRRSFGCSPSAFRDRHRQAG